MNDKLKDTMNKLTDSVKEGVEKVSNNETVSSAMDKVNDNEYVKKIKGNKNYKYIRIGAVAVLAVVVIAVFGALFGGDKYAKKAVKAVEDDIVTYNSLGGYNGFKINSDVVVKNKKQHLYIVDGTYTCKDGGGDKIEGSDIYIVYSDKDKTEVLENYSYSSDTSRKDMIKFAEGQLEQYSK